jgi:hypothetical protein
MNYTHLRGEQLVYQMIMILKTIIVKTLALAIQPLEFNHLKFAAASTVSV